MRDARAENPTRSSLAIPALAFAVVALTVGLVARQTVRSPYSTPFFHLWGGKSCATNMEG